MSAVGMTEPTDPKPRKKLSVLIVQMGDQGEVYRTLMALKAVKFLYPELGIHVIARDECAESLRYVGWLDSVIATPKVNGGDQAVAQVAQWIEKVIHQNYDILANWTATARYRRMAAIATSLIPAIIKVGDYVRDDMTIASFDAWSMYRNAWMNEPIEQDIHMTDVITTQLLTLLQIHAGDPAEDHSLSSVTSKYFFTIPTEQIPEAWATRSKKLKWVGVNLLNAPERTSEWIDMVLRRHPDTGIVLIGGSGEDEWVSHPRVIHFSEPLTFSQRVNVISQCQWFFSAPHALADLASLLNVRIFFQAEPSASELSLKWTEEGPYGNGHIVVVPREEWKSEIAYATWSFFESEWFHKNNVTLAGHFQNLELSQGLTDHQIYRSRIRPSQEGGGVSYEQSGGVIRDFESWIFRVRGQMARAWFCGWLPSIDQEVEKLNLTPDLIKKIRSINESLGVMQKLSLEGRSVALDLSRSAPSKGDYLMSIEDRAAIEEYGKKLQEIEALMNRVIHVEPELRCMLKWYQQMLHNLNGETIAQMAKETVEAFDLVSEGVDLIFSYTRKTLERARPRAVAPTASVSEIKPQA